MKCRCSLNGYSAIRAGGGRLVERDSEIGHESVSRIGDVSLPLKDMRAGPSLAAVNPDRTCYA